MEITTLQIVLIFIVACIAGMHIAGLCRAQIETGNINPSLMP